MPFPNKDTQFKPGESGNPSGAAKGSKHLSTWIKELLDDEEFTLADFRGSEYKGAPIKAIVQVAMYKAVEGDKDAREWLAKYGYGNKLEIEHSGEIKGEIDPAKALAYAEFLKKQDV